MTQRNILSQTPHPQAPGGKRSARLLGALLALSMASAWALEILPALGPTTGSQTYRFELVNSGQQRMNQVQLFVDSGYTVTCGAPLTAGRGDLNAGSRVQCSARPVAGRWQGALIASGLNAAGERVTVRSHFGRGGPIVPDQGAVAVLVGSLHADTNTNGMLDTGEEIDYDYTVINLGNQALSALALTDLSGAVSCPATTLAVGAHMTCTRTYTITAADTLEGLVMNEVGVTGTAANSDPVQAVDVDVRFHLGGNAGVMVIKSPMLADDADANGDASEGDLIGYTFVVKNTGALPLSSVDLIEPDPSLIDGPITCEAQALSGNAFTLGTGTLDSLDVVLCSASHVITAAEAAAGEAPNLVEVHGQPPFGPSVVGTGASLVVIPLGTPQIEVTKVANVPNASANGTVIYTVTVSNVGEVAAQGLVISDPLPPGVAAFNWTCAASGGAVCPLAAGTGALMQMVPSLPVGGALTYTVTATLTANPPNPILNVVTVTPNELVICQPEGTPSPCEADVPVGVVVMPLLTPVPVGGGGIVLLLAGLMGLAGARATRRKT